MAIGWLLLVALLPGATASAYVDTPAARDARAAVRALASARASRSDWPNLSYRLGLPDVEYELRMGGSAEAAVMSATAAKLRAGAKGEFAAPQYQTLADALERRAAELQPVAASDWGNACQEEAARHKVITPSDVVAARQVLLDRLDALARVLPSIGSPGDKWGEFLSWQATRDLIYKDSSDLAILNRLEARWSGAPLVWDAPEMIEASLAVQSYIPLYRAFLANETAEERAAAWNELGKLLSANPTTASPDAARIAQLVNLREMLGQGSALTASIRREFSRPNVIFRARTKWLEEQLSEPINERYTVNGVYAGVRQYGQGTMTGAMRCRILPSLSVGHGEFVLDATSRARASGSSEGVSVTSTATTRINGRKPLVLEADGLSTGPAVVSANASVAFNSIDSPGLRRRRMEAERQTYAHRPQAEAAAAADARRETAAEMDKQGRELVAEFNKSYVALRDRQFAAHRSPPEIRIRANADLVQWECRLESPLLFAAPAPPPAFESSADVTLCIAASALEEEALASLAGKKMTGQEISKAIAEMMGGEAEESKRKDDFTATFADRPCEIQFTGGQIRAKFYITAFDSEDVKYPAMTVDAEYNVERREGDLALVRQGSLRVRPWNVEENEPAEISGRQQTLRVAVQRKLNRALEETYLWASPELPLNEAKPTKMQIEAAQVEGGWLQVALENAPAQATAAAKR